jgi:hypothetical protein
MFFWTKRFLGTYSSLYHLILRNYFFSTREAIALAYVFYQISLLFFSPCSRRWRWCRPSLRRPFTTWTIQD